MPTILLIEDSAEAVALVQRTLLTAFDMVVARTLGEAALVLALKTFDLILLDVGLPDGNGFDFYQTLKTTGNLEQTPVIMLTAIDSGDDVSRAFELGVDDYITKPFCRKQFLARVTRRIRKPEPKQAQSGTVDLGQLAVDMNTQRAIVRGETVELTSIEFKILMVLANTPNQAIERESIFKTIWPQEMSNIRTIDTHVSRLRKKLGSELIESVHGVGYRLAV